MVAAAIEARRRHLNDLTARSPTEAVQRAAVEVGCRERSGPRTNRGGDFAVVIADWCRRNDGPGSS
ncbi:hypothetical protein HBB16_05340 [Pseudonocardia sp. MCCB 268]|nr:hypothetical protein [Pseudonocardia cytotoxica]